jgi:hypothetical protein
MPIVNKANGLLAEFAIFPVEPGSQANLVASAIQNIESTIERKAGFASGSVLRSRDGLRVTSYIQWSDKASYVATEPFADFTAPDVHFLKSLHPNPQVASCSLPLIWMDLSILAFSK